MAHILVGCKTARSQGRYRWSHDEVHRALVEILEQERQKKRQTHMRPTPSIQLMGGGSSSKKTKKSILQLAQSWDMKVNLGRKINFPQVIQRALTPH